MDSHGGFIFLTMNRRVFESPPSTQRRALVDARREMKWARFTSTIALNASGESMKFWTSKFSWRVAQSAGLGTPTRAGSSIASSKVIGSHPSVHLCEWSPGAACNKCENFKAARGPERKRSSRNGAGTVPHPDSLP